MSISEAILVTGGAGYIGSHICKALSEGGFFPIAYDDLSTGHRDFVRWGEFVEGDICNGARLRHAMATHRVTHVVHCAAESLVAKSMLEPGLFHAVNVVGTQVLLDAMQDTGCRSIVFSSSGAVYGVPRTSLVDEDAPCAPVSPYGETKRAVEVMLAERRGNGLQATALRYFNAVGADPAGEIGERHNPETHLMPRAICAALGRIADFGIFGTDYNTPDGTAIRDYVHVTDIARAHLQALRLHAQGRVGNVYNIGAGHGTSVKEIVSAVQAVVGKSVPLTLAPRRAGDPPYLVADIERAKSELGFSPQRSDLATIVGDAVVWHMKDCRVLS